MSKAELRFAYGALGRHIHSMPRSYESLRAELEHILGRYRAHATARDRGWGGLTREQAVKRIRQLGFTEGDAQRWLGSEPSSKPSKIMAARRSGILI
jgi:hypothetical protein